MAQFKSLLKSLNLKPAGKKRKCYHDVKHHIAMGELVLEVTEGMNKSSGYCACCALEMLTNARTELDELEVVLKQQN